MGALVAVLSFTATASAATFAQTSPLRPILPGTYGTSRPMTTTVTPITAHASSIGMFTPPPAGGGVKSGSAIEPSHRRPSDRERRSGRMISSRANACVSAYPQECDRHGPDSPQFLSVGTELAPRGRQLAASMPVFDRVFARLLRRPVSCSSWRSDHATCENAAGNFRPAAAPGVVFSPADRHRCKATAGARKARASASRFCRYNCRQAEAAGQKDAFPAAGRQLRLVR